MSTHSSKNSKKSRTQIYTELRYIDPQTRVLNYYYRKVTLEVRDGEKNRQTPAQIVEWITAVWNWQAYDALTGVYFCSDSA